MTDHRLLAVTGGTGFVGQALLDRAGATGVPVRALARSAQASRDGVEWVAGDLAASGALDRLVDGASAVIHVAGVVNAPDPAGFEAGNVEGTLALIEAARRANVARIVFVSSLAAREPQLSAYGASKARAEKLVKASGLDWTIVRPPAVYGPRDREMLELFRAARWGMVPMPAKGRASLIHVDDLARLLLTLAGRDERTSHKLYEPDDGRRHGWSHKELAWAIGKAVGKRVAVPRLGPGLLRTAARADRLLRGRRAKLTLDRARYMTHPDWVSREAARPPAGLWHPEIAAQDGLAATAAWYREAGWL